VAEVTDEPVGAYEGYRELFTALVPPMDLQRVLNRTGGIGHTVSCSGPNPSIGPEGGYVPCFWIMGPGGKKYVTLTPSWLNHNERVVLPDAGLLMTYGLVPRFVKEAVEWDDPRAPEYSVVRVTPRWRYSVDGDSTPARIEVAANYLEDYLSLLNRTAVAVFFEKRYSLNDPSIEAMLGKEETASIRLPGCTLDLRRVEPQYSNGANQLTKVWGCRLLLRPQSRPISNREHLALDWPSYGVVAPGGHQWEPFDEVYVKDDVLVYFEARDEFAVSPESGGLSYDGWWSVSYCSRYSRNCIRLEIRKLYEGAPKNIIQHYQQHAVMRDEAEQDLVRDGPRHIGIRAKEVLDGFFSLTEALVQLATDLGLTLADSEVAGITRAEASYRGWWNLGPTKALGHVVPIAMNREDFLQRCVDLNNLLEHVRSAPLRLILKKLGVEDEVFKDRGTLKMIDALAQLAVLARQEGLSLIGDFAQVHARWNRKGRLPEIAPLFAVNALRNIRSHAAGPTADRTLENNCAVFGIDMSSTVPGWGYALDTVYDGLAEALDTAADLIRR
jgi:hypothetical protein